MANRRHRYNYYEDETARRYPRIQTIRLLTEGAAGTFLDHGRRRLHDGLDEDFDDFHSLRMPSPRQSTFIGIFPLMRKIILYGSLATFLLLLSIGEFGLVYMLTMPGLHSNEILHFDYTGSGIANQVLGGNKEPTMVCDKPQDNTLGSCSNTTNPVFPSRIASLNPLQNFDIDQTYQILWQTAPVAVVDLRSNHDAWQHYHPDVIPSFKQNERILKAAAPHYVEVLLDLPESQTNLQEIGIFSVVVELRSAASKDGSKLLASSTRTARMPHESNWISALRKFLCLPLHLSGALPEQRTILVPAYRFFVETRDDPLRYIMVKLLVSPETARKGAMVEVTSGRVRIGEEPTGVRWLLKEWFFLCGVVVTAFFFGLQSLLLLLLRLCCCGKRQQQEPDEVFIDNVSEGLGLDGLSDNSDGMYEPINHDGDDNDNSEQPRQAHVDDDDPDQWEDLPTTQADSQPTVAQAGNTAEARRTEESHHWIPDN